MEPVEGSSLLRELTLSSVMEGVPTGYRGNTERLYFASARLEVPEGRSVSKVIYLTHCHLDLHITVRWIGEKAPGCRSFSLRLRGVPAEYSFTVGQEIPLAGVDGAFTIPRIGSGRTWHETRAGRNYNDEVTGELVTYRLTSGTHPLLSLYGDGEQILKEIDLERFFRKLPVGLDENTEQEFNLLLTVDGTKIVVTEMSGTDWEEGGGLG